MLRRFLGTTLLLSWVAVTLGCGGTKAENKPNFEPKAAPKVAGGGGGEGTSTAKDG